MVKLTSLVVLLFAGHTFALDRSRVLKATKPAGGGTKKPKTAKKPKLAKQSKAPKATHGPGKVNIKTTKPPAGGNAPKQPKLSKAPKAAKSTKAPKAPKAPNAKAVKAPNGSPNAPPTLAPTTQFVSGETLTVLRATVNPTVCADLSSYDNDMRTKLQATLPTGITVTQVASECIAAGVARRLQAGATQELVSAIKTESNPTFKVETENLLNAVTEAAKDTLGEDATITAQVSDGESGLEGTSDAFKGQATLSPTSAPTESIFGEYPDIDFYFSQIL